MNSCNGILITGYSKSSQHFDGRLEDYSRNEIYAYKKFKRGFKFNSDENCILTIEMHNW